jgi:hypothetical protein
MKFEVCSGTKSKEARTIIQMIQNGGTNDGGNFGTVTTWTGELLECGRLFFFGFELERRKLNFSFCRPSNLSDTHPWVLACADPIRMQGNDVNIYVTVIKLRGTIT